MSELSVGQLRGLTVNSNVITVPSGHQLIAPGHVIQAVSVTSTTAVSTNSTNFVSAGISATITPRFASSRILILTFSPVWIPSRLVIGSWTIFRGTVADTNLGNGIVGMGYVYPGGNDSLFANVNLSFLDSPATTSAQTYTLAMRSSGSAASVFSQRDGGLGSMTLLEIAS